MEDMGPRRSIRMEYPRRDSSQGPPAYEDYRYPEEPLPVYKP